MIFSSRNLSLLSICLTLIACGCGKKNRNVYQGEEGQAGGVENEQQIHNEALGEVDGSAAVNDVNEDKVYFGYDSSSVNEAGMSVVNRIAQRMAAEPGLKVTVEGHCDERGTEEYNLALGEKRARMVRKALVNAGIPRNNISVVSYSFLRPAVEGHNEEAWKHNRRAAFVFN